MQGSMCTYVDVGLLYIHAERCTATDNCTPKHAAAAGALFVSAHAAAAAAATAVAQLLLFRRVASILSTVTS
jgi:hypothetical protein